jgi:drug/metabolite transporter (DMT)-like permease
MNDSAVTANAHPQPTSAQPKLFSWLLLFSCNLMWSLQFTCIKLVQDQAGPLFTVWFPTAVSLAVLYPFVLAERRQNGSSTIVDPTRKRRNLFLVYTVLCVFGVIPGQLFMTWGTRMSLASNAALLTLTLPITTAIFAVLFLKEKMTGLRWASFALAIAGIALCSGLDVHSVRFDRSQLLGNLLVFGAILGSSFYNSYGKAALEWHSPMEMLFWTYAGLTLLMTPFVVVLEKQSFRNLPHFTISTWGGLAMLMVFHTTLSMILFLKALKSIDAIQAALSNYLIAFFGLPIAALWLHEHISSGEIIGGILVLSSTLLITVLERPREESVLP